MSAQSIDHAINCFTISSPSSNRTSAYTLARLCPPRTAFNHSIGMSSIPNRAPTIGSSYPKSCTTYPSSRQRLLRSYRYRRRARPPPPPRRWTMSRAAVRRMPTAMRHRDSLGRSNRRWRVRRCRADERGWVGRRPCATVRAPPHFPTIAMRADSMSKCGCELIRLSPIIKWSKIGLHIPSILNCLPPKYGNISTLSTAYLSQGADPSSTIDCLPMSQNWSNFEDQQLT